MEKAQIKEELDETRINMYIQSLSEKKNKAYFIAKSHLGNTFNTLKSVGYLYWEKEKKKDLDLDFEKQKELEKELEQELEKQKELEQELKNALEKAQEKIKIKIKVKKIKI